MTRRGLAGSALVTVLLLLATAMAAYWFWSAARLEQWLTQASKDLRDQGYQIAYQGPEISGFPFNLTARLDEPSVTTPGGTRWQGPVLSGQLALLDPRVIRIDLTGAYSLQTKKDSIDASFAAASAEITLRTDGRADRVRLDLAGIELQPSNRPAVTAAALAIQMGPWQAATADQLDQVALWLDLADLALPDQPELPLGPTVTRLVVELTLHGLPPPGDLKRALQQWQAAGGHLEIKSSRLLWGPLTLGAERNLTLDSELRPAGHLMVQAGGLPETLARLEQHGLIQPAQLKTLRRVLDTLAKIPGQSADQVSLPVTLRDGRVFLGPVPLARLSPVL